jgi:tRNA threonylcarbamoyladenosine biosynthesis protein TsaE
MSLVRTWKKVYLSDIEGLISEFKDALPAPSVLILTGEVGAGKTSFLKIFTKASGAMIQSPSYNLVSEWGPYIHADFYRLKDKEEIYHLELGLYLEGKEYFFVEWGRDYLDILKREVPEEFNFYELKISINGPSEIDHEGNSRNYELYKI